MVHRLWPHHPLLSLTHDRVVDEPLDVQLLHDHGLLELQHVARRFVRGPRVEAVGCTGRDTAEEGGAVGIEVDVGHVEHCWLEAKHPLAEGGRKSVEDQATGTVTERFTASSRMET